MDPIEAQPQPVNTFEINVEIERKQRIKKSYKCRVENDGVSLLAFRKLNTDLFKDVFFRKGGGLIPISSENDYTIGDALENNKIVLKSDDDDIIEEVKDATAPTIVTTKTFQTTAADDTSPKLSQAVPTVIETTTKDTAKLTRFTIDKPVITQTLSVLKIRQTIDTNFQSNSGAITWELNDSIISVPEETLTTDLMFTYNELQHTAYKYGIYQGGGKISRALKASADVKASFSREKLNQQKKGTIYLHSYYSVPRLDLRISSNNIKLDPEFKNQLLEISKKPENSQLLMELLETYGTKIPTRFVLGGKITFDDKKVISNSVQREKSLKSFSYEVNASIQYLTGGMNSGASSEKEKKEINVSESTNTTKTILGGDPTRANNLNDWMNSLNDASSWSIIQKDKFISIWDIIKKDCDAEIYNNLFNISNQFLKSVDIVSSYKKDGSSYIKINGLESTNFENEFESKIKDLDSKVNEMNITSNTSITSVPDENGATELTSIPNQSSKIKNEISEEIKKLKKTFKISEEKRLLNISIINPYNSNCEIKTYYSDSDEDSLKFCEFISSNLIDKEGHYMIISSHGNIFSHLSNDAKKFLKSLDSTINRNFTFVIICKIKKGVPHFKLSKTNKKSNTYLTLNLN